MTFAERSAAERAAEDMAHKLIIRGQRCKLMWGKPQAERRPALDPMLPSLAPPGAPGMPPPAMLPPQVCVCVGLRMRGKERVAEMLGVCCCGGLLALLSVGSASACQIMSEAMALSTLGGDLAGGPSL